MKWIEMTSRKVSIQRPEAHHRMLPQLYVKDSCPQSPVCGRDRRIAEAPEMQLSFSPEEQRDVAWDANRRGNTLIMSLATGAD